MQSATLVLRHYVQGLNLFTPGTPVHLNQTSSVSQPTQYTGYTWTYERGTHVQYTYIYMQVWRSRETRRL